MTRLCSYHSLIKTSGSCELEVAALFPCGSKTAVPFPCGSETVSAPPCGTAGAASSCEVAVSVLPFGPADSTSSCEAAVSVFLCGPADSTSSCEAAVSTLSCEMTGDQNCSNMRTRITSISFPLRGPKSNNLKMLSRPLGTASSLILLPMKVRVQEHQTTFSKLFKHRYLNALEAFAKATGLASSLSGCVSFTGQRCSFQHRRHTEDFHAACRACVFSPVRAPCLSTFRWFSSGGGKRLIASARVARPVLMHSSNHLPSG
jgi:hypothetical protein